MYLVNVVLIYFTFSKPPFVGNLNSSEPTPKSTIAVEWKAMFERTTVYSHNANRVYTEISDVNAFFLIKKNLVMN